MEIRRMSPGDLDAACEVIGLAFQDNPNTLAIARGQRSRARRMMEAAVRAAKLGRPVSHVWIAEDDGQVVGVLNAAPWPACQPGMGEKLRTAPAMIRAMGRGLPSALRLTSVWARHDPREPHWHVGPIGVRPGLQGRGIGRTLLTSFLRMVDAQALPAYLETDVDRNVALYEHFGFAIVGRAEINGVDNRFMWRPARASAVPARS